MSTVSWNFGSTTVRRGGGVTGRGVGFPFSCVFRFAFSFCAGLHFAQPTSRPHSLPDLATPSAEVPQPISDVGQAVLDRITHSSAPG